MTQLASGIFNIKKSNNFYDIIFTNPNIVLSIDNNSVVDYTDAYTTYDLILNGVSALNDGKLYSISIAPSNGCKAVLNIAGKRISISEITVDSASVLVTVKLGTITIATGRINVSRVRDGLQGPSIVFAGVWDATKQYYGYSDTQTAVIYQNKYYYTKTVAVSLSPLTIPKGAIYNPSTVNGKVYWNEFVGQFDNIATGLLLAERINTSELTTNKLFIVNRDEASGNIIDKSGVQITKSEEAKLSSSAIIGRLTKGWFLDQGVIRSVATNAGTSIPKLQLDADGTITATGANITGTVNIQDGNIGSMQIFNTSAWTSTVNGPFPASSGSYYLRKTKGVTITPQGHIIGKDYFLTGDSAVGPSVFVGDVYVPGYDVPGMDDASLTGFLNLWNSLFEKVAVGGQYLIKAKLPLFSVGEITAFGNDGSVLPSIWESLPVDKITIDLIDGKLTVIGGIGAISRVVLPIMGNADALTYASVNAEGNILTFTAKTFVLPTDIRLTNARPASDVSAWAKASVKPTYSWSEIASKQVATASLAGIVKIGGNILVSSDGTISVPNPTVYVLPVATASILGGVKIASQGNLTVTTGGTLDTIPLMRFQGRTIADLNDPDAIVPGSYGISGAVTNGVAGMAYTSMLTASNLDTGLQIVGGYTSNRLWFRGWTSNGTNYTTWNEVLANNNYLNFTVSKTGTGASGNWGISITGNSATSTKLSSTKQLWGNAFDGSSNINGNIIFSSGATLYTNGSLLLKQAITNNGTGISWKKLDTSATIAGIGSLTIGDTLTHMYMGWGTNPYELTTSFSVASTYIRYKGKEVFTADSYTTLDSRYLPALQYHTPSGGTLITTSISDAVDSMCTVLIYGNSYTTNMPIDTKLQLYSRGSAQSITNAFAINNGYRISKIYAFVQDGVLKLWIPTISMYNSIFVQLHNQLGKGNLVTDMRDSALPTVGVTRQIIIEPKDSVLNDDLNKYLPLTGGELTGAIVAPEFIRKTNASSANLLRADGGVHNFDNTVYAGTPDGVWGSNVEHSSQRYSPRNFEVYSSLNFTKINGADVTGGYDANTMFGVDGGITSQYVSQTYWKNTPPNMRYGSVLTLASGYVYSASGPLRGQFAWDVAHNTDNGSNYLWFRTSNNLGWNSTWDMVLTDRNQELKIGKFYVTTSGDSTKSGRLTLPYITLNVGTGTAPMIITSKTLVSNLNAEMINGLKTDAIYVNEQFGFRADYIHSVILLFKENEIGNHLISGKYYTRGSGANRYACVDVDIWYSRWSATASESSFKAINTGIETLYLIKCMYNGESWFALNSNVTQATNYFFMGITNNVPKPVLINYYNSSTKVVINAEIYNSITSTDSHLRPMRYGTDTIAYLSSTVAAAGKLQNSRTIFGIPFDGTANVVGALTGATTITASSTVTAPTFIGKLQGTADQAVILAATRNIVLTGDSTGTAAFNGSQNATINVTNNHSTLSDNTTRLQFTDSRNVPFDPPGMGIKGIVADFKTKTTSELSDGSGYNGVVTFKKYTDRSGGKTSQFAFTDNSNLWIRFGLDTWESWKKVYTSEDLQVSYVNSKLTVTSFSGTFTENWTPNSAGVAGYVAAPSSSQGNMVWKTDVSGNPAWRIDETGFDTKNTAGSLNSTSTMFLIGATTQATNPVTYSNNIIQMDSTGLVVSGNRVLHAGNYYIYSPTYNNVFEQVLYSAPLGVLVSTNIADTLNAMVTVHITGNSYQLGKKPIDTYIQFYFYQGSAPAYVKTILNYSCINNGYDLGNINVFSYKGIISLWFNPASRSSQSYRVTVNLSNISGIDRQVNRVTSLANSEMPTDGVTELITITPNQSAMLTDNVASATKLATPRQIQLTGSVTGSVQFDGTENVSINTLYTDGTYLRLTGGTVTGNITAPRFISNVAAGTSPLMVTSNTMVANLNSNYISGYSASQSQSNSTVAVRNGSGDIYQRYVISNSPKNEVPTIDQFIVTNNSDGYHRQSSIDHVVNQLSNRPDGLVRGGYASYISGKIKQWIRIAEFLSYTHANATFSIYSTYNYNTPSGIIFSVTCGYPNSQATFDSQAQLTMLSGNSTVFSKIRLLANTAPGSKSYVEVYYDGSTSGNNQLYINKIGGNSGFLYSELIPGGIDDGYIAKELDLNGGKGIVTEKIIANQIVGEITGNASSSTKLQTPRTLWGQQFDGTSDVMGSLTNVASIVAAGDITVTGNIVSSTKITSTGSGNGYNNGAYEARGNGTVNTVYPSYGFHQPQVGGGSLQFRTNRFHFRTISDTDDADLTIKNLYGRSFIDSNTTVLGRINFGTSNLELISNAPNGIKFLPGVESTAMYLSKTGALTIAAGLQIGGNFIAGTATFGGMVSFTDRINVGYTNSSYKISTASLICNDWIRTNGAAGWYSQTYGGGIQMTDSTYVKISNNKKLKVTDTSGDSITTTGGLTVNGITLTSAGGILFSGTGNIQLRKNNIQVWSQANTNVDAISTYMDYLTFGNGVGHTTVVTGKSILFTPGSATNAMTLIANGSGSPQCTLSIDGAINITQNLSLSDDITISSLKSEGGSIVFYNDSVSATVVGQCWKLFGAMNSAAYGSACLSLWAYSRDTSKRVIDFKPNGDVLCYSNFVAEGEVTAYSDERLKSNIKSLNYRGRLHAKSFTKDNKQQIGFIAQDIQSLYPELITVSDNKNKYLSLNYGAITAVLSVQVNQIEDEVSILKNKIKQLEDKLEQYEKQFDKNIKQ